jgi:riboflavin synthase
MFTGLIEATGQIVERQAAPGGLQLWIDSAIAAELKAGDSLAVNGVCLTVVTTDTSRIRADVGPETIRVTTLGKLTQGACVNLERPLRADGRFGGHFVQGHIDAVGVLERRRPEAEFEWLTFSFPSDLAPYIVHKGSIAVDGISLTVATLEDDHFDVQIVPFTLEHTNLRSILPGESVNLECDLVGKYVARAVEIAALAREG